MAKINIKFNNTEYSIDESALSSATDFLKSHLSTVMNGSGATINLGGTAYNVDATKLSAATNDFISHLSTITGNGHKVMVNGVEYGIDSTKLTGAISDIEAVLAGTGEERLEGDGAEFYTLAPTALSFRSTAPLNELQEIQINGVTVDPSNYTLEEGSTIVTFPIDYLKTLNVGSYEVAVASDSKTVKGGFTVTAPELNECGFYYNQPYTAFVPYYSSQCTFFIREDGTYDFINGTYIETGTFEMDGNSIMTHSTLGDVPATLVSSEEICCEALGASFILGSDTSITADKDYIYVYNEELGGYEVTAIDKTKAEYGAIKTGINGIDTVKLADKIFRGNTNLVVATTIPDSVTTIGDHAFEGCSSLTSITIPDSVITIDAYVFEGCSSLTSVTIPDGIIHIGTHAFGSCTSLKSVVIPDSVTSISNSAFSNCTNLRSITFGGTVAQWRAANGNSLANIPAIEVVCSDGTVNLN